MASQTDLQPVQQKDRSRFWIGARISAWGVTGRPQWKQG